MVAVLKMMEYGNVVSSACKLAPSSLNWTPAIPMLSVAVAERSTLRPTVAPFAGAVITTELGGVLSTLIPAISPAVSTRP